MSKKVVTLTLEVFFDGDYYQTSELVDLVEHWIHGGLEDRSDVVGWTTEGYAEEMEFSDNEF